VEGLPKARFLRGFRSPSHIIKPLQFRPKTVLLTLKALPSILGFRQFLFTLDKSFYYSKYNKGSFKIQKRTTLKRKSKSIRFSNYGFFFKGVRQIHGKTTDTTSEEVNRFGGKLGV
jgi:hypothetical protein